MKVVFRVTQERDLEHVRAESDDPKATLIDFQNEIAKKYPHERRYCWRHRPSREVLRDFESSTTRVRFYARFTVPHDPNAKSVATPVVTPLGDQDGED